MDDATAFFAKYKSTRCTLAHAAGSVRMHILTKPEAKAYLRDVETGAIVKYDRYSAPPIVKPGAEEHEVDMLLMRRPGDVPPATAKQVAFIVTLREKVAANWPMLYHSTQMAAADAAIAALALSLPEPRTMAEASIMIDCLQRGDIREYARWRPVWNQPILDRLAVRLGEHGEHAQVAQPDGSEWTWPTWRAYVEGLIADNR